MFDWWLLGEGFAVACTVASGVGLRGIVSVTSSVWNGYVAVSRGYSFDETGVTVVVGENVWHSFGTLPFEGSLAIVDSDAVSDGC